MWDEYLLMDRIKRIKNDLQPHKTYYEADVKLRILHMFESGEVSYDLLAQSFGISEQTIYNWRKEYDKNGVMGLDENNR